MSKTFSRGRRRTEGKCGYVNEKRNEGEETKGTNSPVKNFRHPPHNPTEP